MEQLYLIQAKAIVEGYKEGKYDVFEGNCEHFASEVVLGIDFSRQEVPPKENCRIM